MCVGKSSERRLIDGPFLINYDWIFGFFFHACDNDIPFCECGHSFYSLENVYFVTSLCSSGTNLRMGIKIIRCAPYLYSTLAFQDINTVSCQRNISTMDSNNTTNSDTTILEYKTLEQHEVSITHSLRVRPPSSRKSPCSCG